MPIFLDTETTGLSLDDEILEIAIVDTDGSTLLNTLIKPKHRTSWPQAQKIHGISPAMLKHFPDIDPWVPIIREICEGRHLVIYNADYDMQYLHFIVGLPRQISCAMLAFCRLYGSERWQKLDFAVSYCGYQFDGDAHRALSDARAARAVWNYIEKRKGKNG